MSAISKLIQGIEKGLLIQALQSIPKMVPDLRYHQTSVNKDHSMIGTVETLNGDVGEDGKRCGEVVLSLLLPDEDELIKARTSLKTSEYERAVEAHE